MLRFFDIVDYDDDLFRKVWESDWVIFLFRLQIQIFIGQDFGFDILNVFLIKFYQIIMMLVD